MFHYVSDLRPFFYFLETSKKSNVTHLDAQFTRHVSERLQLLDVFADAFQIVLAELILRVDQREDPLHQPGPEVWQNLSQAHTAPCGKEDKNNRFH